VQAKVVEVRKLEIVYCETQASTSTYRNAVLLEIRHCGMGPSVVGNGCLEVGRSTVTMALGGPAPHWSRAALSNSQTCKEQESKREAAVN
jgi:hypothetical protein